MQSPAGSPSSAQNHGAYVRHAVEAARPVFASPHTLPLMAAALLRRVRKRELFCHILQIGFHKLPVGTSEPAPRDAAFFAAAR